MVVHNKRTTCLITAPYINSGNFWSEIMHNFHANSKPFPNAENVINIAVMSVINFYLLLPSCSSLELHSPCDLTVLFCICNWPSLASQSPWGTLCLCSHIVPPWCIQHITHLIVRHTHLGPFSFWLTSNTAKLLIIFLSHYSPVVLHLAQGLGESGVRPQIPG